MVATDIGVYILNHNSSTWVNYSTGLPIVIVSDIEFNAAQKKVYISTFGRGIWEADLEQVKALQFVGVGEHAATLDFKAYPTSGRGEITVETPGNGRYELAVVDVMGRKVYQSILERSISLVSLNVVPGAYYLRISDGSGTGVRKIIIE